MKKKKKIIIVIISIIIIFAIIGIKYVSSFKNKPLSVKVETVAKKNLVNTISVSGIIVANDSQEFFLSPTQKVLNIFIEENQQVKNGDKLLKLDTSDLEYSLKKGQLNLDIAKKDLEKLQNSKNNSTKTTLESSVIQAELNLESAEMKFNEAKKKQELNLKLYEEGFLSKDELNSFEITLKDLENNVKNAEILLQNAQVALDDFLNPEDNIYRQSKQIEIAKIDIANLNKNITNSILKSNINGTIVRLDAKEGQYPVQGDMIVIQDLSYYKLKVNVNQYDAVGLEIGQVALIKIKGLNKEYKGKIARISQTAIVEMSGANLETKVEIEIVIDNPDDKIKTGYVADADITLDEKRNIIAVGFDAVQKDPDGKKFVFIVEDNIAKKRYVETGLESDFDMEIVSGLKEGDKYITNVPAELEEGDTIIVNGGM